MNSVDTIRFHMQKVAAKKEVAKQQHKNKPKDFSLHQDGDEQQFLSLESKCLLAFHSASSITSLLNISKYVTSELTTCHSVILLKIMSDESSCRLYFRGGNIFEFYESYKISDFECLQDLILSKAPIFHNDETGKQLNILVQWKPLFGYIPDMVVAIPIVNSQNKVAAIVGISFKNKLPKQFFEKKLPVLKDTLGVLVPYAFIIQSTTDNEDALSNITCVLESIEKVEKAMGNTAAELALTQIGLEIANLANCKNLTIFLIDEGDQLLRKYHSNFGHPGRSSCPNKKVHQLMEISMKDDTIAALTWVAYHKKGMRINSLSDFSDFRIAPKSIHSIGNCNTRALMIAPVVDYSGESALLVELADKEKGFSLKDFEMVLLFCQHTACLLTCTVLLDRREKNFRRRNIINEMLCSISFVKHATVEQFITHHRKTSNVFRGGFDEFSLSIRGFHEHDIAGVALEIFYELDVVKDFKIRRSILVRFIMSVQQGYGPLPYHNWYHAVSVAHYAYLLVRKLKLIEEGHLNKLEAFALVVSALTHDIDHRGTNNQFQSYTNSDIYKLYACEDSVMERHHLSIALAILHREDCNILESFNDTDYKYFVELLTWNIIATDISKHIKTREKLFVEARSTNAKVRKMARLSLFMTAADLCDNCKKWDDSLPTVKGILQEFFNQGDMERQLGFQPIPMMDRYVAFIPLIEYKFLKFIVTPVYRFLSEIYVELKPCIANIRRCEDLWTLATIVFNKRKVGWDPLDILDLPEMKEENLMKIVINEPIEVMKHRTFSLEAVPPPASTVPSITTTTIQTTSVDKTIGTGTPTPSLLSEKPLHLEEEELEDVDTGERRKSKFSTFCSNCCPCCYKKK